MVLNRNCSSVRDSQRLLLAILAAEKEELLTPNLQEVANSLPENFDLEVLWIGVETYPGPSLKELKKRNGQSVHQRILRIPEGHGQGEQQKFIFEYALQQGFDWVAVQDRNDQAVNISTLLLEASKRQDFDGFFGIHRNRNSDSFVNRVAGSVFQWLQARITGRSLCSLAGGARVYRVSSLREIPFQYADSEALFAAQIAIQLLRAGYQVQELSFDGFGSANVEKRPSRFQLIAPLLASVIHDLGIRHQRYFELGDTEPEYDVKLGYRSSHTAAIESVPSGSSVLDIGCGRGLISRELRRKDCEVVGLDRRAPDPENVSRFLRWDLNSETIPEKVQQFDYIMMLDIIEHLYQPEDFLSRLRRKAGLSQPKFIITTPNVGFFLVRLGLFFGQWNYGKEGILDYTHTRLFTFSSLRMTMRQAGYKILKAQGIPAPFPKALGDRRIAHWLLKLNEILIQISPAIFSYQIYLEAQPLPSVEVLIQRNLSQKSQPNLSGWAPLRAPVPVMEADLESNSRDLQENMQRNRSKSMHKPSRISRDMSEHSSNSSVDKSSGS